MRGKHPSLIAWEVMLNEAEIMAWLAMTAAMMPMTRK